MEFGLDTEIVNLDIISGTSYAFDCYFEGVSDSFIDAFLTVRLDYNTNIVLQKRLNDGITLVEQTDKISVYSVRLAPEDTVNLQSGVYVFDLIFVTEYDKIPILYGTLEIKTGVTRNEVLE